MAVNTEQRHFECTKCKDTFSQIDHYEAKNQRCGRGGKHNLKVVQASWNGSLLGSAVNLAARGVRAGVNGARRSEEDHTDDYENAARIEQIRLQRQAEEEEQAKKDNQELAVKTIRVYKVVKPFLKFIIPAYLIAFAVIFFTVKAKPLVVILFALPIVGIMFLIYNAITNKPNND